MRLLPLLLVAALLAGCAGPGPLGGLVGGGDLTAKDAHNKVLPRAQQWQGDAGLAAVGATEAREPGDFEDEGDFPFAMGADSNVGDGRAPQWFLRYYSPSTDRYLSTVVYANGTILTQEERASEDEDVTVDLAKWQVDSPQAVQVAMQDANFSAAARASDGGILLMLAPKGGGPYNMGAYGQPGGNFTPPEDPFWMLTAHSDTEDRGAVVLVNARTGQRFEFPFPFGPFGGDFPGGFPYGASPTVYSFSGQLSAQSPSRSHDFEVKAQHRVLDAELDWSGALPTDRATLEIRTPGGQPLRPDTEDSASSGYQATYTVPGPGEYTAVVSLASESPGPGVGVSYTLTLELR